MNVAIDPHTGTPRWEASRANRGPKEDFAYEAAVRLLGGKIDLETLREQIIAAANLAWEQAGDGRALYTLNDVKSALGGSAKDWFHEIQKVAHSPEALSKLVSQKGKGLTALSRSVTPLQAQRAKGFVSPTPSQKIKPLVDVLSELRLKLDKCSDAKLRREVLLEVGADLKKYSSFRKRVNATE